MHGRFSRLVLVPVLAILFLGIMDRRFENAMQLTTYIQRDGIKSCEKSTSPNWTTLLSWALGSFARRKHVAVDTTLRNRLLNKPAVSQTNYHQSQRFYRYRPTIFRGRPLLPSTGSIPLPFSHYQIVTTSLPRSFTPSTCI